MSARLNSLMVSSGNTIYHTPEFFAYVKSHERILKQNSVRTPLDPGIVHNFEFNFVSLLIEMRLPLEDLAFMMVCNDFVDPSDMTRDFKEMRMPQTELVSNLKTLYRQKQGRI